MEDLAYRILNCGVRTVEEALAALRADGHEIPLRGQQMDMGRGVSHKVQAVRLFLERKSYTEIQRRINHSPQAIQRYIENFRRCGAHHGRIRGAGDRFSAPHLAHVSPRVPKALRHLQHRRLA